MTNLKYPIGEYHHPADVDMVQIDKWVSDLEKFPQELIAITSTLTEAQLDVAYRPGGWTVRQVIHHLADSHVNAYTRVKLTLSEDNPVIRPYDETTWAELPDAKNGDIGMSIEMIKAIHHRLVTTFRETPINDFGRQYIHPTGHQQLNLSYLVGSYAWHGKHHLAHILSTLSS
ncbi:MAG: YfiT family bacillithiol transferase [Bacteroidia bacterium]